MISFFEIITVIGVRVALVTSLINDLVVPEVRHGGSWWRRILERRLFFIFNSVEASQTTPEVERQRTWMQYVPSTEVAADAAATRHGLAQILLESL